jgi:hypothetical protein
MSTFLEPNTQNHGPSNINPPHKTSLVKLEPPQLLCEGQIRFRSLFQVALCPPSYPTGRVLLRLRLTPSRGAPTKRAPRSKRAPRIPPGETTTRKTATRKTDPGEMAPTPPRGSASRGSVGHTPVESAALFRPACRAPVRYPKPGSRNPRAVCTLTNRF